ncbi:hypothetical protein [Marinobacterium sediminicola]|uniref:Uncharacterized protein n=1 Tax=Marinobacterium sediminicola TaxID=518898 RepID=A0ABY1S236_9GAMM|nr:hypothetical protein [Marinobacterium sediminicola]ULG68540.1 hypothetical protein LN244_12655 [Marinobacterium sediminicola]SMR76607.1 hypothetical protein SAMN04487964_11214 [Marinobacterium sediminicola]
MSEIKHPLILEYLEFMKTADPFLFPSNDAEYEAALEAVEQALEASED